MNNDWKDLISGTFGCEDLIFAGHHSNKERAEKLLIDALSNGIGFGDYINSIQQWLESAVEKKGSPKDFAESHIREQMARVRDVSIYFTSD